ncbi:bifunctional oligoribonuclease/PAP phosphatase NrnA [Lachnospiraceae bacterium MD1]|jgi:phosphoesterase RecJ-like protein|uniref:Bifunctional oligoribonuclease/PAP phosphatase NrnA n=1 Tax=Variimorphobacter saccharofermentans TaxID=2755051 RepID=A0A839JZR4_9FIRM|nr:bifunctional oligoribonuclease/PAP phosphatase NrnA [Variimorphobacter saccharofermentans]MBB2182884.1 bifunctional oligoribonuclease/PAP phosphatase NrnA [Variimorphobacter saccharofermentans]
MNNINAEVIGAKKIAIAGHIRPDGDCIGSCTALYLYLKQYQEELGIDQVDVYLERFGNEFRILAGVDNILHSYDNEECYDVFISLDCGSLDRLGNALKYYNQAKKTINIDHHISNQSFAMVNHVVADASSTCEVLYSLMEEDHITKEIAEALYVGIIHDTGVFKHSNTSEKTMQIAGKLISKGIAFSKLIDESFYSKTYVQNQILGRCLMESLLIMNGKVVVSSISRKMLDFYEATHSDLDGIIDQLRIIKGVEVAIFISETDVQDYKVSMRSNGEVNVSKIAVYFGGGGHIKAAGCSMKGSLHDVINNLTPHIEAQLKQIKEKKSQA